MQYEYFLTSREFPLSGPAIHWLCVLLQGQFALLATLVPHTCLKCMLVTGTKINKVVNSSLDCEEVVQNSQATDCVILASVCIP